MGKINKKSKFSIKFKKIKDNIKYVVVFGFLGFLVGGIFLYVSVNFQKNKKIEDISQELIKISNLKINQINSYFSEVKNEINGLANSSETKNLLKRPIIVDKNIIKIDVDQKAKIIAKEVENYIKNYPEKTFEELKNDSVFQKIAVQSIGLDGYSAIENFEEQLSSFQKSNEFIGAQYENIKGNSPKLYTKLLEDINKPDISGFYDWKEPNGKTRKIYVHLIRIGIKTVDGISLMLVATNYVDNYKIIKENIDDLNLNFFEENTKKEDFNNLILIDPNGYLVYMKDSKEGLGANLNWPVNQESELAKNFVRVKNESKILFSDAYLDRYGEIYPEFMVSSPVYDQNKLLGYVVLTKDMSTFFKITEDTQNLGKTGESYLVSRNQKLLISPLRYGYFDMFVQNIDTDNVNNCFKGEPKMAKILINYNGELTVATHAVISELPWCLITEIKKDEVLNVSFKKEWIVAVILFCLFCFTGALMAIKTDKRSIKEIKMILKIKGMIAKIEIKYIVLFSLFFVVGYFFFITSFFQGWKNVAFYDEISDLFTTAVLIILLGYGFKIKDISAQKLIIGGSFLAIFDKLIQIILEEYINKFGLISSYFWIPGAVIGLIGLLLIFYGFKKELKL